MTRALICGFGRAGRRHGATLDRLGIEWHCVEPIQSKTDRVEKFFFPDLETAFDTGKKLFDLTFDFAIICTPPSLHLQQILTCLDAGLPVLCEKPLCALGQFGEAETLLSHPLAHRVMMAQNYHFHPALVTLKRQQELWEGLGGDWACFSDQHRTDVPEWGLLLDHVSHSVDILLWLSGMETLEVSRATHSVNENMETWFVDGTIGIQQFNIWESVRKAQVNKRAWVSGPFGNMEVVTSQPAMEQMMDAMYKVFLAHLESPDFPISFKDGVRAQRVLERIAEVAND